MDTQSKFERLIKDSEFSAFILGNPDMDNFVMVSEPPTGAYAEELKERGFGFVGCIGVSNGWPRTALSVPLEPQAIHSISQAYVQFVIERFTPKDDGAAWMERLHQLPDPRTN